MIRERNELEFELKGKNDGAKINGIFVSDNSENGLSWEEFIGKNIAKKRLILLRLLEGKVKEGDLKAIELYNRILSEIRDDLRSDGEEDWLSVVESMVSGGDGDE